MRFVGGVDEKGGEIDVRDPLATDLRRASDAATDDAGRVEALLGFRSIFPVDLANMIKRDVTAAYIRLKAIGARNSVIEVTG